MLPKQYNSDLHKKVQILLGSISNLTNLQPFNEQKISMKDNFWSKTWNMVEYQIEISLIWMHRLSYVVIKIKEGESKLIRKYSYITGFKINFLL